MNSSLSTFVTGARAATAFSKGQVSTVADEPARRAASRQRAANKGGRSVL